MQSLRWSISRIFIFLIWFSQSSSHSAGVCLHLPFWFQTKLTSPHVMFQKDQSWQLFLTYKKKQMFSSRLALIVFCLSYALYFFLQYLWSCRSLIGFIPQVQVMDIVCLSSFFMNHNMMTILVEEHLK